MVIGATMNQSFIHRLSASPRFRREAGLTMIEMLVALTIGGILIFGATQAYVDSRNAYAANETITRMQETARFAMSVLEPDIRMSNYWGLLKGAEAISNKKKSTEEVPELGGDAADQCGNNFPLDLENNIRGWDAEYGLQECAAWSFARPDGGAMPNADTFVVRRASVNPSAAPLVAGPLRICSNRLTGALVDDPADAACDAAQDENPTGQMNDLVVNYYYLDRNSEGRDGVPALRRWFLGPEPAMNDVEVISGIEDMQIQYGVDRTGGEGPSQGAATQYLNAGADLDALLDDPAGPAQIVSVRIWLLVRSDVPEPGFADDRIYEYGSRLRRNGITGDLLSAADRNKAYQPSANADETFTSVKRFRRVLVSRTINLRNAIGT
jgi:type IV pilus assembly protein PilW